MVGSAILRRLAAQGYTNIVCRTRRELDLLCQPAVHAFFATEQPEYVFLAAAKVGGIKANDTFPADFIYENMMIAGNVIHSAYRHAVSKLLFLGSSCIYPRLAPQPLKEDCLLTGRLEPTNEAYAVAKICGITLCRMYRRQYGCDFISAMPTNLYGPNDTYHPEHAHVIPALIKRFHEARAGNAPAVSCWGTGTPRREFLYVDDLADACLFLMQHYSGEEHINVGSGSDVTIRELATMVAATIGYTGRITWDTTQPDGTPQKLLDVSKIHALGWRHTTSLAQGLRLAYGDFCRSGQG